MESQPPQRDITAERLADGTRLAKVWIADRRGHRAIQRAQDDEEEGVVSLSSLAGPKPGKPVRLRAAEVLGERGTRAGEFSCPTGLAVDG